MIRVAQNKADQASGWLAKVLARRNKNVAAVALANKNARIVRTLLVKDRQYSSTYPAKCGSAV